MQCTRRATDGFANLLGDFILYSWSPILEQRDRSCDPRAAPHIALAGAFSKCTHTHNNNTPSLVLRIAEVYLTCSGFEYCRSETGKTVTRLFTPYSPSS
jgi:hypothetical protein